MNVTAQRLELLPLEPPSRQRSWMNASTIPCNAGVQFDTISDIANFETLGPEWSSLFEAFGQPHQVFQTFEWLAIWVKLYVDADRRLSIVTGRIDGRLVMVWPLVVQKSLGIRVLIGMGDPLTQYSDVLMAAGLEDAVVEAALTYVMALPVDVIALRRVRDDATIAPLLRHRLGAAANRQASPFVDLSDAPSAEAFDARFSGKLRASRRRRRRRLEERGPVTFTHHGPSPEAAALAKTALDFKRDWARRTGVLAPALRDPRFEQFFVAAALAGPKAPDLRVSVLRSGEEICGIEISVVCKGHLFGHVLAPSPSLVALGVGGILAESIIHNARDRGYSAVDLLAPADSYKLEWTATSAGVGDYCRSRTLLGLMYTQVWLRFGREGLKKIVRYLRPSISMLSRRLTSHSKLGAGV